MKCENMLVASVNGKIVGFCGYGKSRDMSAEKNTGELIGLDVLHEYQNQRIGKTLLKTGLDKLRTIGCQLVTLWVLESNYHAITFYQMNGFKWDNTVKETMLGKEIYEKRFFKTI